LRLVVLEKDPAIAQQQTGHNSGVIHSGIYYAPGSLKARACVLGARLLASFCDEQGIRYERCGKVIVATEARELPGLEELARRGAANGVPGLELIGPERLRELEPHAVGMRALHSPSTAIVDFREVAAALARRVEAQGGEIRTAHPVTRIQESASQVAIGTPPADFTARTVVACAGLQADRLARLTGAPPDPQILPFRGDYYMLRPDRRHLLRGMIYPVPDPAFPFLGVHFTRRIDGAVWLGPNAVLAFAREGYHLRQVSLRDTWESLTWPGFWRLARRYPRVGILEMYRDVSKRAFVGALRRYVPELQLRDAVRGPSGVRAQALGRDGKLLDDFQISRGERVIHVRNAPSPAATSSLAIARMIADEVEKAPAG
jgi:L-2-hydroxyglutarate oxidase LhgO